MRWSKRHDDDNLNSLLRGEGGGRLGSALTELQEKAPEAPGELRERVRLLAAEEPAEEASRRPRHAPFRLSYARAGALAAAVLVVAVAIPAIAAMSGDGGPSSASGDEAGNAEAVSPQPSDTRVVSPPAAPPRSRGSDPPARLASPKPAPAPPATAAATPPAPPEADGGFGFNAPREKPEAAPLPSASRAQDYSANLTLHVENQDELSEAVQSAIRSTRQLGGYVTYVDYGTSGRRNGRAEVSVRVPVGRVQAAVARFNELGTILDQQTEIRDLQGQIDRITRDIQARRDRIAKLEAELKDPTLSEAERDRLEARLVLAKRGLANAAQNRAGVIRQSRFAKLDLAFTTEERSEPAPPPSELRKTLDDALGVLAAELGVLLYVLIAGAPFFALALLALLGARALRRGADARVLERA
jgi:Domain of unknown function (DUF4349)